MFVECKRLPRVLKIRSVLHTFTSYSARCHSGRMAKMFFHRASHLEWDAGVINKSQSVCLSLAVLHTHTRTRAHAHLYGPLIANSSVPHDGSIAKALTDEGSLQCLLRLGVLCSGLASQFTWDEQSPCVAWGDDRVLPDENEKKKGTETHAVLGHSIIGNQGVIFYINGDSDEARLVCRINHKEMDCFFLMSVLGSVKSWPHMISRPLRRVKD